eukprot:1388488-Prymnesium_polylepis.1
MTSRKGRSHRRNQIAKGMTAFSDEESSDLETFVGLQRRVPAPTLDGAARQSWGRCLSARACRRACGCV